MRSSFLPSATKMTCIHVSIIYDLVYNLKSRLFCIMKSEISLYISVLNCKPSVKDTDEVIHELNKTNGLFKFVRTMRKKFQEAVAQGTILALSNDSMHDWGGGGSGPLSIPIII